MVLNEFLLPACIHTGDVVDDAFAAATGWGLKPDQGVVSNALKKVSYSLTLLIRKYFLS